MRGSALAISRDAVIKNAVIMNAVFLDAVILGARGGGRATTISGAGTDARDERLSALMKAAQGGDRHAYAALLRECEPLIRRAAASVGIRGDRVEDVIQESLLTLHGARHTYDSSRSFAAWLTVIAKRRGIDVLRRAGRTDSREVHAPLTYEQHADPSADAARGWEDAGRAGELRAAIAGLTPGQREAVEHLALREQTLAEAAVETGKSVGALKVNFHRALKVLKARLAGREAPDV